MRIRMAATLLVSAVLVTVAMGCREEGPAEKFGRKVDDATGQASDAVARAGNAVDRAGGRAGNAVDRAGDAIDRAADKAKKKLGGD